MKKKDVKKAVAYVHIATVMQEDDSKVKAQLEAIKSYAEIHGIELVAEYEDYGKSGNKLADRLGFISMLEAIESEEVKVDYVIVDRLSRLGRNVTDTLTTLDRLKSCGVNLICTQNGIDSSNSSDMLQMMMLLVNISTNKFYL